MHTESDSQIVLIVRASGCEHPNAALSRAHQRGTPFSSSTRLHVRRPWMNLPISAYSQKRCMVSVEVVPPSVRFWLSCHMLDPGYKCVHSIRCIQPAAHRPCAPPESSECRPTHLQVTVSCCNVKIGYLCFSSLPWSAPEVLRASGCPRTNAFPTQHFCSHLLMSSLIAHI